MSDGPTALPDVAGRPAEAAPRLDTAWATTRSWLVKLAVKWVWDRDDAEDLVQECFRIAVVRGRQPEKARPWFVRTLSNLCMNHRRRRKLRPLSEAVEPSQAASPSREMLRLEELESLRSEIDALPDRQRIALVLRTMEQWDYEQIAELMKLSAAAVRTHVHLARRRLAERLDGRNCEEP